MLKQTYIQDKQGREEFDVFREALEFVGGQQKFGQICLFPPPICSSEWQVLLRFLRRVNIQPPHTLRNWTQITLCRILQKYTILIIVSPNVQLLLQLLFVTLNVMTNYRSSFKLFLTNKYLTFSFIFPWDKWQMSYLHYGMSAPQIMDALV